MKKFDIPKIDFRAFAEDFKNLNPRDVGAWPLAPRIVTLVAIFIGIIVAGWWFDWNGQTEELDAKRNDEGRLRADWKNKKQQAVNLELHRQQLAEIDRSFGTLLKQLPNKNEMESLIVEINQAGLGRGLTFDLFKPGGEVTREFYAELPITLKINGTYHDIGAFASDIGRLPRIVTLNDIALKLSSATAGGGMLSLDATAKTFRYLDDEELAKQKKAAGGSKPAAPKPAAPQKGGH